MEHRKLTWEEEIAVGRLRGYFTPEQRARAHCWNTCAVGKTFGRVLYMYPLELKDKLISLGCVFYTAVEENNFDLADSLHSQIKEEHTRYLAQRESVQ